MSSSNPPTYVPSHLPLLASWSSYKDSTLSLLPSNLEKDLEEFRNLVLQSENPESLPDNRDEMAEQMLSALEKVKLVPFVEARA